jgi:CheY-like chemotaxis protein
VSKPTILVVDDAAENISILGELLTGEHDIRIATSGEDTLALMLSEGQAIAGKDSGTGLGTYSARRMIEAQQGSIALQTDPEAGTSLTVKLPRAPR